MAINVADNFSYKGSKPLDARIKANTVSDLVSTPAADLYDGCFAYVTGTKKYYSYDSTNTSDPTLGKWREFQQGGGGGGSLPSGGTTGQSLVKHSDSDDDVEWFDVTKEISLDDFNNLTQEEKDNGTSYYIPDATVVSNLTVMGNRFDKANIYTTDERVVGSFLGKPLYQKTITGLKFPASITDGEAKSKSYYLGNDLGIENVETVTYYTGIYSENTIPMIWFRNSSLYCRRIAFQKIVDDMYITTSSNRDSDSDQTIDSITIQYTKSTDTTVNIGTGNDYSTDEQIIGTWIDGKPLYQKTIDLGNLPNATTKQVNTEISNVKRLINYSATATDSNGGNIAFPRLWLGGSGDMYIGFGSNLSTINVATTSDRSGMTGYCTVQYTKTTD